MGKRFLLTFGWDNTNCVNLRNSGYLNVKKMGLRFPCAGVITCHILLEALFHQREKTLTVDFQHDVGVRRSVGEVVPVNDCLPTRKVSS